MNDLGTPELQEAFTKEFLLCLRDVPNVPRSSLCLCELGGETRRSFASFASFAVIPPAGEFRMNLGFRCSPATPRRDRRVPRGAQG
jgi:hypothetical protein